MQAKSREKQVQLYGLDLLWLLAKRHYEKLPQPSEMMYGDTRPKGPSAEDIKKSILERLGGASE